MTALILAVALTLGQQPKQVKIYMNVANTGHSEMYAIHVQTRMHMLDEEGKGYELRWIPQATDAEFILTLAMDRDPDTGKYLTMTHLWKKGSTRIFETINQQLDRDPDKIAKTVAKELERAMGLTEMRIAENNQKENNEK